MICVAAGGTQAAAPTPAQAQQRRDYSSGCKHGSGGAHQSLELEALPHDRQLRVDDDVVVQVGDDVGVDHGACGRERGGGQSGFDAWHDWKAGRALQPRSKQARWAAPNHTMPSGAAHNAGPGRQPIAHQAPAAWACPRQLPPRPAVPRSWRAYRQGRRGAPPRRPGWWGAAPAGGKMGPWIVRHFATNCTPLVIRKGKAISKRQPGLTTSWLSPSPLTRQPSPPHPTPSSSPGSRCCPATRGAAPPAARRAARPAAACSCS